MSFSCKSSKLPMSELINCVMIKNIPKIKNQATFTLNTHIGIFLVRLSRSKRTATLTSRSYFGAKEVELKIFKFGGEIFIKRFELDKGIMEQELIGRSNKSFNKLRDVSLNTLKKEFKERAKQYLVPVVLRYMET